MANLDVFAIAVKMKQCPLDQVYLALKSLSRRNSETQMPDTCVVFYNRLSLLQMSVHRSLLL